jgi:hypothetical protein
VTTKSWKIRSFIHFSPICFIQRHRFETCLYSLIHGSLKVSYKFINIWVFVYICIKLWFNMIICR